MPIPTQSFSFYYVVTVSSGILQTDGIPQSHDINGVVEDLIDNLQNGPTDDPGILGDVFKDQMNGEVGDIPTGSGTYLGLAFNAANHSSGIL